MKRIEDLRILWGVLLILGGGLLLLTNLDILNLNIAPLFWSIALGGAGAVFTWTFITNRESWWAIIPGLTLLSVAASILLSLIVPKGSEALSGPIVTGGIGLSFFLIYLTQRQQWWAMIPAGVMLSVAVTAFLSALMKNGELPAAALFLGLSATFGTLYFSPLDGAGRQKWAIYPALATLGLALILLTVFTIEVMWYIWPFGLIALGIYFIVKTFKNQPPVQETSEETVKEMR